MVQGQVRAYDLGSLAIPETYRLPKSVDSSLVHGKPAPLDARPLILVVDDNEQNRALVQTTLEEEGHRVRVASGGDEALSIFDEERPDCVLLDVRMPGTD